jgi:hypothetical protein
MIIQDRVMFQQQRSSLEPAFEERYLGTYYLASRIQVMYSISCSCSCSCSCYQNNATASVMYDENLAASYI